MVRERKIAQAKEREKKRSGDTPTVIAVCGLRLEVGISSDV